MPPKRKAAAKKAGGGKRTKVEVATKDSKPATIQDAVQALKEADKGKVRKSKVDTGFEDSVNYEVYQDYDCMLNQTNIGHNNNKFYVAQVLVEADCGEYFTWNRWGRVGESGQSALKGPFTVDDAIKDFKKKFSDKTKNKWEARADFVPKPNKYTLIEMSADDDDGDEVDAAPKQSLCKSVAKDIAPCNLDKQTQALIKLIFDQDMFCEAMEKMEIDVKKMPLGKLSKAQIAKGFECLEAIGEWMSKKTAGASLDSLTSRFYTVIPHSFGRQVPPLINTQEKLQAKKDMLLVLGDIELAQSMQKEQIKEEVKSEVEPHPLDVNYNLLNCDLTLLGKKSKEFKIIQTYLDSTMSHYKLGLEEVWEVNRHNEDKLFKAHDKKENRKLLWHGTNVAVVAAILKSGLRIMPHSGGRVGRGIYFASENRKSAAYVRSVRKTGIMFLNEVVLGKEYHITRDDPSLRAAPAGYDSVIAMGRTEPDPKADTVIKLDGKKVVVPQGKPIDTSESSSSFGSSEYLVYKECQNRIRYLLKLKFPY